MGSRADQIRDKLHQKMLAAIGDDYLALEDRIRLGLFKAIGDAFEELGWGTGEVPEGGESGSVLGKLSEADYHYGWIDLDISGADHTSLSNLAWTVSGHTGAPNTVAGWDEDGKPVAKQEVVPKPYNPIKDPYLLIIR